jgi:hypothetical protein
MDQRHHQRALHRRLLLIVVGTALRAVRSPSAGHHPQLLALLKIEIGAFTLCAGGLESPEDLTREAADTIQVVAGLRAVSGQAYNRGNRVHTVRFQMTRSYASIQAAELALLDHPAEVPTSGNVKITTEGSSPDVRYLLNATAHAFAARQIGVSLVWVYTLTGGAISASP